MSSVCSFSLSFVVQICKKFCAQCHPEPLRGIATVIIRRSFGYLQGHFYHLFNFFNIETEITSYSLTTAPESCLEDSPMILSSMLWPRTDLYLVPERDSIGPLRSGVIRWFALIILKIDIQYLAYNRLRPLPSGPRESSDNRYWSVSSIGSGGMSMSAAWIWDHRRKCSMQVAT